MTRRTSTLALLVALGGGLVGGCAVGERPVLTQEALLDGDTAADGSASGGGDPEGPATGLPPLSTLGDAPPALMTPTGVVVPVVSRTDSGYLVLSPCGIETELPWGQAIPGADVVLDAGHGGDEKGALGPSGETEAELNLDITRRAAVLLEAQGVPTVLTRTGDYRIPISNRAALADRLSARAFVSIHHNAPTPEPSTVPGSEMYVQVGSEESRRLGGLIHEEVVEALTPLGTEWSALPDHGVLTVVNSEGENSYGINRYPTTPTVLAELAYLSNPAEAALLATPEYRQAAAEAVARGIVRYLETTDPGSGYVDAPRLFNPAPAGGGTNGCVDPPLS